MADVTILYCPVWSGYDRRAASLAAEIESRTDSTAQIRQGKPSQFDVVADEQLLFSKQAEGRFPEADEILAKLS